MQSTRCMVCVTLYVITNLLIMIITHIQLTLRIAPIVFPEQASDTPSTKDTKSKLSTMPSKPRQPDSITADYISASINPIRLYSIQYPFKSSQDAIISPINYIKLKTSSRKSKPLQWSSVVAESKSSGRRRNSKRKLVSELYVSGYDRPHPELCPALGANLKLLVFVTSAPSNANARLAIRFTWGSFAKRKDIALAFILGTPSSNVRSTVESEDELYGDIIIGRSVDSYSNLTLKTVSILEWVNTYCSEAPRLLKTNDDVFINLPRLLSFATDPSRINATKTIWGKVMKNKTKRKPSQYGYCVPSVEFPGNVFPDFISGAGYLMTADCVRDLLDTALSETLLRFEDVFLTGVLANKLGIVKQHSREFFNMPMSLHPCAIKMCLSFHRVQYEEQFILWKKLMEKRKFCRIRRVSRDLTVAYNIPS